MKCALKIHLEKTKQLAEIRSEKHEAARILGEIKKHNELCVVCNGVTDQSSTRLADSLFGGNVVVGKQFADS